MSDLSMTTLMQQDFMFEPWKNIQRNVITGQERESWKWSLNRDLSDSLLQWNYTNAQFAESAFVVAVALLVAKISGSERIVITIQAESLLSEASSLVFCLQHNTFTDRIIKAVQQILFSHESVETDGIEKSNETSNVAVGQFRDGLPEGVDLIFQLVPVQDGLEIQLRCRQPQPVQVFERWGEFLDNILNSFSGDQIQVKDVRLLAANEHRRILETCTGPIRSLPHEDVLDALRAICDSYGDATAVHSDNAVITYQELWSRSQSIAHYLQTVAGVSRGDVVGVHVHKSEELIICMIGVMMAGAVYLPIDPTIPEERLNMMLCKAGATTLITAFAPELTTAIEVIHAPFEYGLPDGHEFVLDVDSTDIAYIIFTSGSTGEPKGVPIQHAGLANVALDHVAVFGFSHDDQYMSLLNHSFDGFMLDVWMILLSGGTLWLANSEMMLMPDRLVDFIRENRITATTITPSYLKAIGRRTLHPMRLLISAGEEAIAADLAFHASYLSVYNGYGPTEAAVNTSLYHVPKAIGESSFVPIGKPRLNKAMYVLDQYHDLLPVNIEGELYISGCGVTNGYLGQTEQGPFIQPTFASGTRAYCTGDHAVLLDDGNFRFLGRRDSQLKINGYRIDMTEIQSALRRIEGISDSYVTAMRSPHVSILAFVVDGPDERDIAEILKKSLPHYMMPSRIVPVNALPLNRSGKVDVSALIQKMPAITESPHSDAMTTEEQIVIRAFEKVFDIPITRESDFFALGGNSLMAIAVVSSVMESDYGIDIADLFDFPVVKDLSSTIAAKLPVNGGN